MSDSKEILEQYDLSSWSCGDAFKAVMVWCVRKATTLQSYIP